MQNLILRVIFLSLVLGVLCHRKAGEKCTLFNNEGHEVGNGICAVDYYCDFISQLEEMEIQLQNCSTHGHRPIICCPVNMNLTGAKSSEYCLENHKQWQTINDDGNYIWYGGASGGTDARPKEFPHMAVLGYGGDTKEIIWGCGGSLISEKFVLTAAHCLKPRELGPVKHVRLGDLNLKRTDDIAEPQDFQVAAAFPHPDYKPPSNYHDIALLQLDREIRVTDFVRMACLNIKAHNEPRSYVATGWGLLEYGGPTADHLQKVTVDNYENEKCNKHYKAFNERRLTSGIVKEWQICAGGSIQDTCKGDSGGPLGWYKEAYYTAHELHGITSFGKVCGIGDTPGVYTRISYYIEWIESIVWPN